MSSSESSDVFQAQSSSVVIGSCNTSAPTASASSLINFSSFSAFLPSRDSDTVGFIGQGVTGPDGLFSAVNDSNRLSTLVITSTGNYVNLSSLCDHVSPACPIMGNTNFTLAFTLPTDLEYKSQDTRILLLDAGMTGSQLLCSDISITATATNAQSLFLLVLISSILLAAGFWLTSAVSRFISARTRTRDRRIVTAVLGAASGMGLKEYPSLARFASPGGSEIVHYLQWVTSLGFVAVAWTGIGYAFLSKLSWTWLLFKIGFPEDNIPSQSNDLIPFTLENGASDFAASMGLASRNLFPICATIFACIFAGILAISLLAYIADMIMHLRHRQRHTQQQFHIPFLQGNITRLIMLFHLPIVALSTYHLTLKDSAVTTAFAALVLVTFAVIFPAVTMWRVHAKPQAKLYDTTHTLLALGPLYVHYGSASTPLFFCGPLAHSTIWGIVLGAIQSSPIAQVVILLVLEIARILVYSTYLPWTAGATMGAFTFFMCSVKIITAALLTPLIPSAHLSVNARVWIVYSIFIIQAVTFVVLGVILLSKVIEGSVRLAGRILFDKESGLIGAIGEWGQVRPSAGIDGEPSQRPYTLPLSVGASEKLIRTRQSSQSSNIGGTLTGIHTPSSPVATLKNQQLREELEEDEDEDDQGIMSAWKNNPRRSQAYSDDYSPGEHVPRGT